jgi:hypothetical protein
VGLGVWWSIRAREEARGVPVLSREEAAARVAREDKFGLPSRLEHPPERDLARALRTGTVTDPFTADAEGVADLFHTYAVTVKGCRGLLPREVRDAGLLPIYVTLVTADDRGRVDAVDGLGEGIATRPFTQCLLGGVKGAVFTRPERPEITFGHRLTIP